MQWRGKLEERREAAVPGRTAEGETISRMLGAVFRSREVCSRGTSRRGFQKLTQREAFQVDRSVRSRAHDCSQTGNLVVPID
jgi:hypothetical protein